MVLMIILPKPFGVLLTVRLMTNLHINNKKAYISKFEQIDVDKIYNWHLIGKEQYGRFVIDEDGTAKLINFLVNNKNKYKYTQEEYNSRKAEQLRK
jgi:hypothetical protein